MILAVDKMDEHGLSNTAHHAKVMWVIATEGLSNSSNEMESFRYKVSGKICSDAFKRRLAFSFTVITLS